MLAIGYLTYEEYRSAMDNIDRFKRATDNEYGESKTAEERGKLEKPESTKDSPATKAQKDEIVKLLHKRELSWDPDKEKFVPEEGEIGAFIEERFNIILERSPRGKGDFYNPKSGYEYDLVGPTSATAKGKYKVHNVIRQIINHLRYDKTVVVLSNLSVEDKKIVLEFINSLDKTDLNKIILIDKM